MKRTAFVSASCILACLPGRPARALPPKDTSPGVWAALGMEAPLLVGGPIVWNLTSRKLEAFSGLFFGGIGVAVGLGVGSAKGEWDDRIAYGIHGALWGITEGMALGSLLVHGDEDSAFGALGWASAVGGLLLGGLASWAQLAVTDDWVDFAWVAGGQGVGLLTGGLAYGMYLLVHSFDESAGGTAGSGSSTSPERVGAWLVIGGLLLGHAVGLVVAAVRRPESRGGQSAGLRGKPVSFGAGLEGLGLTWTW